MQIINKKFSQNTFNGWDASKPLKALVMTSPGFSIAKQLKQLGKTLDFDVFILSFRFKV